MGGNDPLCDRQAQPHSALIATPGLPERLEEMRLEVVRNARAGVRHTEDDLSAPVGGSQCHPPALLRELECVADEIANDLEKAPLIGSHPALAFRRPCTQLDATFGSSSNERLV